MNVVQRNEKKNEHRVKNFDIRLASFTDIAGWGKAYHSYAQISDTVSLVRFGVMGTVRKIHAKTTTS